MDTLTHGLSGALLAQALAPSNPSSSDLSTKARLAAGFAAAAFPDFDFSLRLVDTLTYLNWHQGPTHSIFLLPLWALGLAHLFSWISRRRYLPRAFLLPVFLGLGIHILGDVVTAYGTMLFAPITQKRFSLPLAFVIDPYLTAIVVGGLIAVLRFPGSRPAAALAFAALGCYMGLLTVLHFRAMEIAREYAAAQDLAGAVIHALPQPLTPFNWKMIVAHGDRFDEALVNLWRTRNPAPTGSGSGPLTRMAASYHPAASAAWTSHARFGDSPSQEALARDAWNQDALARFRAFAAYPVLDRIESEGQRVCVWFLDLRFTLPALPPSFRYGACRGAPEGTWHLERLRGSFWID